MRGLKVEQEVGYADIYSERWREMGRWVRDTCNEPKIGRFFVGENEH